GRGWYGGGGAGARWGTGRASTAAPTRPPSPTNRRGARFSAEARVPYAVQRASGAPQIRDRTHSAFRTIPCLQRSVTLRHSASKTRVNALEVLHCARETSSPRRRHRLVASVGRHALEAFGGAAHEAVHGAPGGGRIFERHVAPQAAAAGEHRLAVEDALGLEARHRDPVALAAQIRDVLALAERHRLHVVGDRPFGR